MRKIYLLLTAILFSCSMWAQQEDLVITWLPEGDLEKINVTANANSTMSSVMEFDQTDILYHEESGKRLTTIKNVQFYITPKHRSTISNFKVIILQGNAITSAKTEVSQDVSNDELADGWNTVELDEPFTIDNSKKLFIGCQMKFSTEYYPIEVVVTEEPVNKQAWFKLNTSAYSNLGQRLWAFSIKALATTDELMDNEIMLTEIGPRGGVLEETPLTATIRNLGKNTITSFKATSNITGKDPIVKEITGVNIQSGETYNFSPTSITPEGTDLINYNIVVSDPNGAEDYYKGNNSLTNKIQFVTELVQRQVLHESFTGSTCGYCNPGNVATKKAIDATDPSKWVMIKYQMNYPSPGDPYYTSESGTRANYYSVQGIPHLVVDAPAGFVGNSMDYTKEILEDLAKNPAYAKIEAVSGREDKTYSLWAKFELLRKAPENADLRFHAAIVEKRTTKNKKTNGETEFFYVMKKFLTPVSGTKLSSFELNTPETMEFEFTFVGNYRLPANASTPINHTTEHSVEDFDNLQVVYWIEDYKNKEVYQAGRVDPDPNMVGIKDEMNNNNEIRVFPNPVKDVLTIQTNANLKKIELINMFGQTVKESTEQTVNVEDLPKGIYLLRISTESGTSVQKIQVQ